MIFDDKEFPPLNNTTTTSQTTTNTTLASSTTTTTSQTSTITAPVPFDYKAELNWINTEIETKLKCQFEDLFAQMEQKINTFMKQYKEQHEEQEIFNANITKKLGYLVDNMQRFLKHASPAVPNNHPLAHMDDGSV